MRVMRAKMVLNHIDQYHDNDGTLVQELLRFNAICKDGAYPADGSDEDNTFSRFTPFAELKMSVANPALLGSLKVGEKYYVDFTPAE